MHLLNHIFTLKTKSWGKLHFHFSILSKIMVLLVLGAKIVARGQSESFQNVGGKGVYDVLTSQKSRGGQEFI